MKCKYLVPGSDLPCAFYLRPDDPDGVGFCSKTSMFLCTEAMKHKLTPISYSQLSDWSACKMRWYYRVVMGLKPTAENTPEPMRMGAAWDRIQTHLYTGTDINLDDLLLSDTQTSKLRALYRAWDELELTSSDTVLGVQHKIKTLIGQNVITGVVDRCYEDYFIESKLSSRPDFYLQLENIMFQCGTYFLAYEQWEYVVMEVVRVPQLKSGYGKFSDESPQAYENRLYADIVSRPSFYFQGYNKDTHTFGVKFYRSEFNLDEVERTFRCMIQEVHDTLERGSWYRNRSACYVPAQCLYVPVCKTGVVSEEIYTKRVQNEIKKNK